MRHPVAYLSVKLLHFRTHLVPNEHLDYVVIGGIGLELREPVLDLGEGLAVGDVVDEDGALPAPVVARRQRPKPLLSGRVPDCQLYLKKEKPSNTFKIEY